MRAALGGKRTASMHSEHLLTRHLMPVPDGQQFPLQPHRIYKVLQRKCLELWVIYYVSTP
jgi:hypothetical protein